MVKDGIKSKKPIIKKIALLVIIILFGIFISPLFRNWVTNKQAEMYIIQINVSEPSNPSDKSGQEAVDKLVSMGSKATPAIINAVSKWGTWSPSVWQLNKALSGIGEPAHQELLTAIDNEQDPLKKVRCIYALQASFADFSRVGNWLETFQGKRANSVKYTEHFLRMQLVAFTDSDVPHILLDSGQLNPMFIQWYKNHKQPKGSLPIWKTIKRG